jgi:hypothetical protein
LPPGSPRATGRRTADGGTWRAAGTHGDAAVATILALSFTDARSFCFGGEVPLVVHDAGRRVVEVVCGQGAAPRLATRAYFAARGGIPGSGPEAAAVPAALDACPTTLDRHGTRTFAEVAAPAPRILDRRERDWHADLPRRSAGSSPPNKVRPQAAAGSGWSAPTSPRPAGPRVRRLVQRPRRPDPSRRPGHPRHPRRRTGRRRLSRPDRVQVRALCAGPLPAPGPPAPEGLRPGGIGPEPAGHGPPHRRGAEAGPGRPRRLLRRPALRGSTAGRTALAPATPRRAGP